MGYGPRPLVLTIVLSLLISSIETESGEIGNYTGRFLGLLNGFKTPAGDTGCYDPREVHLSAVRFLRVPTPEK